MAATNDKPDWTGLKRDVCERIDALRVVWEMTEPVELRDKLRTDLCIPCLRLLSEFCSCVEIEDGEEVPRG